MSVLTLLLMVAYAFSEYRIQKFGSLFRFKILTLLLVVSLLATVVGVLTHYLQKEMKRENQLDALLNTESVFPFYYVNHQSETTLPLCVSQLFNHGKTPWGQVSGFKRINSGTLKLKLFNPVESTHAANDPGMIKALEECPVPIDMENVSYDRSIESVLNQLSRIPLERLEISFSKYAWHGVSNRFGGETFSQNELDEMVGKEIEMTVNFPEMETLLIFLDLDLDQASQLRPFFNLPTLTTFVAIQVNRNGAEFTLENLDQWPVNSRFQFHDDVPRNLIDEIECNFDPTPEHHGLKSVVPVVG